MENEPPRPKTLRHAAFTLSIINAVLLVVDPRSDAWVVVRLVIAGLLVVTGFTMALGWRRTN
jgi:hypothetical protein